MSLIDPAALPGEGLRPWQVAADATTLDGLGTDIRDAGAATLRAWQTLPASYQSDGAEHLYDVMTPVGQASTVIGDGFGAVAAALSAYAEAVTPIQKQLAALKAEAQTFVYQANHYTAHDQVSTDPWVIASGVVTGSILPTVTIDSWDQDQAMVDKNNDLIRRGKDLADQWIAAQETCAAAILTAAGQSPDSTSGRQTPAEIMDQVEAMMPKMPWEGEKDITTPWGSTGSRKESCGEKTLGFPAHLVGGVVTGAYKMVQGVNTLLTGYDGTGVPWYAELIAGAVTGRSDLTGDAWSRAGQAYGGAWMGLSHLAASLNPVQQAIDGLALSPLADVLPDAVKTTMQDQAHADFTALGDTVGGLVGLKLPDQWWESKSWDGYNIAQSWIDDPGGAAGESVFNIGSFFIPGAGEVGAGAHGAEAAGAAAHGAEASHLGGFAEAVGKAGTPLDLIAATKGVDSEVLKGIEPVRLADDAVPPVTDLSEINTVHDLQSKVWSGHDAPVEQLPSAVEHEPALVGSGASGAEHGASGSGAADSVRPPSAEHGSTTVERGPDASPQSHVDASQPSHASGPSHADSGSGSSGSGSSGSGSGASGHGSSGGETPPHGPQHGADGDLGGQPHDAGPHRSSDYVETPPDHVATATDPAVVTLDSGSPGAWNHEMYHSRIEPNTVYVVDDGKYVFHTDDVGRLQHAEGHFDPNQVTDGTARNAYQQRVMPGKIPGYDAGHPFGIRFDTPAEGLNNVPQLSEVNRGAYRALEDSWAKKIDAGHSVDVTIDFSYPHGDPTRIPTGYTVEWNIDGKMYQRSFRN